MWTKSREVHAVLQEWTPVIEPASVDEFYLGLDGTEALYRHEPLEVTAARIREDVRQRTGLMVSIGGGTNRLIAKLAVERAKPRPGTGGNGVFVVPAGEEARFVATLDLVELPGVGPRFGDALRRRGLIHVRDALEIDRGTLALWFGPRTGTWLYDRIRGISRTPLQPRSEPKSVSRETTFHHDLETDDQLETELLRLTARVCHDLRSDGLRARTVTVKLRDFDFRTRQSSRTLAAPVSTERAVLPVALELLRKLRTERRTSARLLGVALHPAVRRGPAQPVGVLRAGRARSRDRARPRGREDDGSDSGAVREDGDPPGPTGRPTGARQHDRGRLEEES